MRNFSEIEKIRRDKVEKLRASNLNPYSKIVFPPIHADFLARQFANSSKQDLEGTPKAAALAGRIMTRRDPFFVIKDASGSFQVYAPKVKLTEKANTILELMDIGDIVNVKGTVMRTNTGALALALEDVVMLTKTFKPLPDKFHGLKDVEERYRRRYIDLIMNDDVRKVFVTRSRIVTLIREFLDAHQYIEVETPILNEIAGGAAARPFITSHNALNRDFYLRIATEISLKKLLVGGLERVYEIGRIFRNEGVDTTHNPEFTSIEFYQAYADLDVMMNLTEDIFRFIAEKLGVESLNVNGEMIDIRKPFQRINMVEAVSKATGEDCANLTLEKAKKIAAKHKVKVEPFFTTGHIINALFEELIEETLIFPTFVTGHPAAISPLAAKDPANPNFTARAELFIGKAERANMFTEIHDPIDQYARFEQQLAEKKQGDDEAFSMDIDFIEALEYGMPPAGGCGIGIDRLVMLFTEQSSIREVLFFPHLKAMKGGEDEK